MPWTNNNSKDGLKLCPFCGGVAAALEWSKDAYTIRCESCRAESDMQGTPEEARDAWNKRYAEE